MLIQSDTHFAYPAYVAYFITCAKLLTRAVTIGMEDAAIIGGHPIARYNLGCVEHRAGRIDRAMNHYTIAAKLDMIVHW